MSLETPENTGQIDGEDAGVVVIGEPPNLAAGDSDAAAAKILPEAAEKSTGGDSSTDNNGSGSSLAVGLSSVLSSVIRSFDSRAEDTIRSQDQLTFAIDRLTGELDQLLDDAPLPFIMQHAARISGVKKRVSSLNALLKSIQRRIDNIDRMLSADIHGKTTMDAAEK